MALTVSPDNEFSNVPSGVAQVRAPLHLQGGSKEDSLSNNIVRNIVSYLSLSDAAAIGSAWEGSEQPIEATWVVTGDTPPHGTAASTTPTPALAPVSPNPQDETVYSTPPPRSGTPFFSRDYSPPTKSSSEDWTETFDNPAQTPSLQENLASAVFAHPHSIRSYCVEAYTEASERKRNRQLTLLAGKKVDGSQSDPMVLLGALLHHAMNNVPLSVALEVVDVIFDVAVDTGFAIFHITRKTIQRIVNAVIDFLRGVWDGVIHFNPLAFLQAIISRPFNAVGKTTEVFVTGIQSVATGVGSASSLALNRLSATAGSSSALAQQGSLRTRLVSPTFNQKLIRKLSSMPAAASVVAYTEMADDTGGLSRHAKSRVKRMMHYEVSLRPFLATVKVPATERAVVDEEVESALSLQTSLRFSDSVSMFETSESHEAEESSNCSSPESPFMCTPQSFPPTPASRQMVLARGTRFADDVIFLARDQLRVHDALDSENERTREMAMALTQGKRLAVFDADDASAGIDLTCGQHVATKVGSMLYCSSRSMVPILRNCFVYFEMTVLPKPNSSLIPQVSMATLSIGLSTKEMPPDTLVGAWKGSVGLCTTGQMLTAGQWCSPADPSMSCYGDNSTVGCLICLDDGSAFETWDGVMVTAAVTFGVNQRIVGSPVSTLPMVAPPTGTTDTKPAPAGSPGAADLGASPPTTIPPPLASPQTSKSILPVAPPFTLPLLVPAEEELYPTVTLHSPGTSVMCRFSAGDVVATSRKAIGAPEGVTVYAADGSAILTKDE